MRTEPNELLMRDQPDPAFFHDLGVYDAAPSAPMKAGGPGDDALPIDHSEDNDDPTKMIPDLPIAPPEDDAPPQFLAPSALQPLPGKQSHVFFLTL